VGQAVKDSMVSIATRVRLKKAIVMLCIPGNHSTTQVKETSSRQEGDIPALPP
jgi:hypothetical protein